MNVGARTLKRRSDVSLDAIHTAVQISRTAAARHRSGEKKPGPIARKRYHAAFGIDPSSWDRELVPRAIRNEPIAPTTTVSPVATGNEPHGAPAFRGNEAAHRLRAQLARIDAMRGRKLSPGALLALEKIELRCATELARFTGESSAFNESKILATPQFRRIVHLMIATLKPYPDAMRALHNALRRFDNNDSTEEST